MGVCEPALGLSAAGGDTPDHWCAGVSDVERAVWPERLEGRHCGQRRRGRCGDRAVEADRVGTRIEPKDPLPVHVGDVQTARGIEGDPRQTHGRHRELGDDDRVGTARLQLARIEVVREHRAVAVSRTVVDARAVNPHRVAVERRGAGIARVGHVGQGLDRPNRYLTRLGAGDRRASAYREQCDCEDQAHPRSGCVGHCSRSRPCHLLSLWFVGAMVRCLGLRAAMRGDLATGAR